MMSYFPAVSEMFGWVALPPCFYLWNLKLNIVHCQAFQTPSSQIRKHICTSYQQSYGRHTDNAGNDATRLFSPTKKFVSASWKKQSRYSMKETDGKVIGDIGIYVRIDLSTQEVWHITIAIIKHLLRGRLCAK